MQSACAVLFCHLCPAWLHHIFLHYLINGTIFGGGGWKLSHMKCLISSIIFAWKVSHLRRIQRDITIDLHVLFVCFWRNSLQRARASSFTRFLDHTQRRTTVGRTPLDVWSARRRDLYFTARNTHKTHLCPRRDSNPQSQQVSGRRPTT